MGNRVLDGPGSRSSSVADELADRAVDERRAAYADEVRRLIDAAYDVMRTTGDIEPRVGDVVRAAGLSNQAFYRHFRSKDELLLAVLTDGRQRLEHTLSARMANAPAGVPQVAAWIEVVLAQARDRTAAENTRPFAVNGHRLADRFPEQWSASRNALLAPLRDAITAVPTTGAGDPARDAEAIYNLAFGAMETAIVRRVVPTRDEVDHLVAFAVAGIERSHHG